MATGDVTVFEESKAKMLDGNWASTDSFYLAIIDNTTTPVAAFAAPVIGSFTQVGSAGSYITNGTDLGTLANLVTETAGTMTFDSTTNPSWAQHASNDTDAWWGIVYNFTDAGKDAVAFVELGGPANMATGSLTVTWDALGIFTIA